MPVIRHVMIKIMSIFLLIMTFSINAEEVKNEVVFKTNKGDIVITLYSETAPKSVENFKQYVTSGFYDGTIFHRTIPGFMIQGGGFDANLKSKKTNDPIKNEANNGIKNTVGTLSMARTGDPHSATSQFFINVNDNVPLDFRDQSIRGWGYAVFGKVTEGLELVMSISTQETTPKGQHQNVPIDTVIIEQAILR